MADTPAGLTRLVETFANNIEAYKANGYNEAQLRREFIDPFFELLGWDVTNKQAWAPAYREVIHEDAIKVGGYTKAPDYCFRIGGVRKFFLEAKKPSIDIKGDPHPAYQLRRYAWSAKLPLSILTDFEEFAVYDCRIRPKQTDKAPAARIIYCNYKQYADRWNQIEAIFSKDAILKGSFDKFAASTKGKRGTTTVDKEFLAEIEKWRKMLARTIALKNPALNREHINFAVQRTIDRILFLRMCEDRGIEDYGRLQALSTGARTYPRLFELFETADDKYNSGLFHFYSEKDRPTPPDDLTPNIVVDDTPLKWILHSLYYPQSPYEFSVLPPEILGNVYEQFLGKVIRLTAAHQARIEEKPEVKKAGGVYYTPSYIVDYIVKNTVGKLCHGKTPRQIAKLRILDPACGSGSFLLGAYTYLLDYHRDWYVANDPQKHTDKIYQGKAGQYFLTIAEKKKILLNNIFGVDIDSAAVEVTKLSLLLKVLEGENAETIGQVRRMFHERALPDLAENIKCGNSLIGPDFFDNLPPDQITHDLHKKINPFHWKTEFPKIFSNKNPGFNAVIGNPPYVRQEVLAQSEKAYFTNHYQSFTNTADLYIYFIEKSLTLLSSRGRFSMIVSNKWMRTTYGKRLRQLLAEKAHIEEIVDFGELPVFQGVGTFPCIVIASASSNGTTSFRYAPLKALEPPLLAQMVSQISFDVSLDSLDTSSPWSLVSSKHAAILAKVRQNSICLCEYCPENIKRGIITGFNKAFVIDSKTRDRLISEDPHSAEIIKPFAVGDDIRKYHIRDRHRFLILTRIGVDIKTYPAIFKHLTPFDQQLKNRWDKGKHWWELRACDYYADFEKPKILYPDIAKESRLAFDPGGLYFTNTVYFIPTDDLYLLGILNSKLIFEYYKRTASVLGDADKGGRVRWFTHHVRKIPVRQINPSDATDLASHAKMVKLVERMLDLHKKLAAATVPDEKTQIQRQIKTTDNQIDNLVYRLYNLTPEEIAIIEQPNK